MARKTLDLEALLTPDHVAMEISDSWVKWDNDRQVQLANWRELQKYIFATDTRQTTNNQLPWKNSTTIPKICQIRDNLFANYKKIIFPRRKWSKWLPSTEEDATLENQEVIRDYMSWVVDQSEFKMEFDRLLLDYIDYGNVFAIPGWVNNTTNSPTGEGKVGYEGPKLSRVSPTDVVMNPLAPSPKDSTFIIRSWMTIGEFAKRISKLTGQEREDAETIFKYMKEIRRGASGNIGGDFKGRQETFEIAGFDNYVTYLQSNYVEVLTFYGDMYDIENDHLYENHVITVVDRHKLVSKKESESILGYPQVIHTGWRKRQDSLWAMGPLENLVGLQYRLDHLENMKADVMDLTVFPPIKVKGYVEDFQYGPGERIYVLDDGDVDLLSPDVSALQINTEIASIMQLMEEMAGAPKEALGMRTPGEKTAFEVDAIMTGASRLFNARSDSFEEDFLEVGMNMLLELGRRKAGQSIIRVFDEEEKVTRFTNLDKTSISGAGRIKPIGARHFSEQSEVIQNIMNFAQSPLAQDPAISVHLSGKRVAKLLEEVLNMEDFDIFSPYIRIAEQAEMAQLQAQAEEQTMMQTQTPAGISPDDYDEGEIDASAGEPNQEEGDPGAEEAGAPTEMGPAPTQ